MISRLYRLKARRTSWRAHGDLAEEDLLTSVKISLGVQKQVSLHQEMVHTVSTVHSFALGNLLLACCSGWWHSTQSRTPDNYLNTINR